MSASIAKTGKGTLLKIGDGASSETFASILEVRTISGPSLDTNFANATHMESPNNFEEEIPSFKVAGDVTLEVNFLPDDSTTQEDVQAAYEGQTLTNFQLTFASFTKTWSFSAYVKSFQPSADPSEVVTASIVLKIKGAVTRS